MHTIVCIGCEAFLVRSAADAAALVRVLGDAAKLRRHFGSGEIVYFPDPEQGSIDVHKVAENQLVERDPKLPPEEPGAAEVWVRQPLPSRRRINGHRKQLLLGQ